MSQPSQSSNAPPFGVPFTVHSEQARVPPGSMKCSMSTHRMSGMTA